MKIKLLATIFTLLMIVLTVAFVAVIQNRNQIIPETTKNPDESVLANINELQVSSSIGNISNNNDGSHTINYVYTFKNTSTEDKIINLAAQSNLAASFNPLAFEIVAFNSSTLSLNSGYNGGGNVQLLSSGNTLEPGETNYIYLTVRLYANGSQGPFNNEITAQGDLEGTVFASSGSTSTSGGSGSGSATSTPPGTNSGGSGTTTSGGTTGSNSTTTTGGTTSTPPTPPSTTTTTGGVTAGGTTGDTTGGTDTTGGATGVTNPPVIPPIVVPGTNSTTTGGTPPTTTTTGTTTTTTGGTGGITGGGGNPDVVASAQVSFTLTSDDQPIIVASASSGLANTSTTEVSTTIPLNLFVGTFIILLLAALNLNKRK